MSVAQKVPHSFRINAENPHFSLVFAKPHGGLQSSPAASKLLVLKGFWCHWAVFSQALHKPRVAGSIPAAAIWRKAPHASYLWGLYFSGLRPTMSDFVAIP
jgi:hypothetical protein